MARDLGRAEHRDERGRRDRENGVRRHDAGRRLQRSYWLAITLIALLALGEFAVLRVVTDMQRHDATIINVAGRQRMLSQRIAGLATSLELNRGQGNASAAARDEALLETAIAEMRAAHRGLTIGDAERGLPGFRSERERALYDDEPLSVSVHVDIFLRDATSVLEASEWRGESHVRLAREARHSLLARLNEVVLFYEREANRIVRWSEWIEAGLFAALLLTLACEVLFIFRPLARRLRRAEIKLRSQQDELKRRSLVDPLTNALNRPAMEEAWDRRVQEGIPEGAALIAIDLDRFKEVNDAFGHEAGDAILRRVAKALRSVQRSSDLVVRMGGDEFLMVVLPEPGAAPLTRTVALSVAQRVSNAILAELSGAQGSVSASLGVSVLPDDGTTLAALTAHADLALYAAKAQGRDRIVLYDPALREAEEERKRMTDTIRWALENDAFEAFFQPQVDVTSGRVVGTEALARCRLADGTILPPGAFLPLAESNGLVVSIGRMVIGKAIKKAAAWTARGLCFGRLSVNASAAQLADGEFATFILNTLARHGLPPSALAIEVLETVVLDENAETIQAVCRRLKNEGVTIELDDFGTGYASIANVNALGIDRIKIDRSIVAEPWRSGNRDILGAIVSMARSLDMDVVAEGVETDAHCERLIELGCHAAQGYHFSRPLPPDDFRTWLEGFAMPVAPPIPGLAVG